MKEIRFRLPRNRRDVRIEGLGIITYQILDLPSFGQRRSDSQIDYLVRTKVGRNIQDSQIISKVNQTFRFEHDGIIWVGEIM